MLRRRKRKDIPPHGFIIKEETSIILSTGLTCPQQKMPVNYLAEMVMDRIAASKIYQGKNYTDAAPYTYFSRNKEFIVMHPETKACLDKILLMLKEKGERKTFAYIRKLLRDGDY